MSTCGRDFILIQKPDGVSRESATVWDLDMACSCRQFNFQLFEFMQIILIGVTMDPMKLEGFMEPWKLGRTVAEARAAIREYARMGFGLS